MSQLFSRGGWSLFLLCVALESYKVHIRHSPRGLDRATGDPQIPALVRLLLVVNKIHSILYIYIVLIFYYRWEYWVTESQHLLSKGTCWYDVTLFSIWIRVHWLHEPSIAWCYVQIKHHSLCYSHTFMPHFRVLALFLRWNPQDKAGLYYILWPFPETLIWRESRWPFLFLSQSLVYWLRSFYGSDLLGVCDKMWLVPTWGYFCFWCLSPELFN